MTSQSKKSLCWRYNVGLRPTIFKYNFLILCAGLIFLAIFALSKGGQVKAAEDTLTFTEDFTSTTYKDSSTTADWEGGGELSLTTNYGNFKADFSSGVELPKATNETAGTNRTKFRESMQLDSEDNPWIAWSGDITDTAVREIFVAHWDPDFDSDGAWVDAGGHDINGARCVHTDYSDCPDFVVGDLTGKAVDEISVPNIVLKNDNPVVSWVVTNGPGNPYELYYAEWNGTDDWVKADGTTPGPELVDNSVNCDSTLVSCPAEKIAAVDIKSNGEPVIAWNMVWFDTATRYDVFYTQYDSVTDDRWETTGGAAGIENLSVVGTGEQAMNPSVAVDSLSQPWVAWEERDGSDTTIWNIKLQYFDGAWQDQSPPADTTHFSSRRGVNLKLIDDQPHMTYNRFFQTDNETYVHYIKYNPAPVSRWENAAGNEFATGCPVACVYDSYTKVAGETINYLSSSSTSFTFDTDDRPYIAYSNKENDTGDYEIYLTRWNGTTWTDLSGIDAGSFGATQITSNAITDQYTSLALDQYDRPLIYWTSDESGSYENYFTRLLPDYAGATAVSKVVDQTDKNIQKATITLEGESQGYKDTFAPQTAVPLGASGSNDYASVACSLSNDNGSNYHAVTIGQAYTFSELGSNLVWKCDLNSDVPFNEPVIDALSIDYTVNLDEPNLVISKSVDTNSDGTFNDNGKSVKPGDTLTYRLDIANTGSDTAVDAVVKDNIPEGTTYIPGSTKLNDDSVSDGALISGLDAGDVAGGSFFQTDWQGGPGQVGYTDYTKFGVQNGISWRTPEKLVAPTADIYYDENFSASGDPVILEETPTPTTPVDISPLVLSDGKVAAAYVTGADVVLDIYQDGQVVSSDVVDQNAYEKSYPRALLLDDKIVVAWVQNDTDAVQLELILRSTDLDGNPQGSESSAVATASSYMQLSQLVRSGDNFFACWTTDVASVFLGGFNNSDLSLIPSPSPWPVNPVQVDTAFGGLEMYEPPSLDINSDGEGIVIFGDVVFMTNLYGHAFDTDGNIAPGNDVDLTNALVNEANDIAALPDGNFVIASAESTGLQGRIVDSALNVLDNDLLAANGYAPSVEVDQNDVVVSWFDDSPLPAPVNMGIFAVSGTGLVATSDSIELDELTLYASPKLDLAEDNRIWLVGSTQDNVAPSYAAGDYFGALLMYGSQAIALLSSVYDAGESTDWGSLVATELVPAGSGISFKVRTGDTATPDSSWSAWTNVTTTLSGDRATSTIPSSLGDTRYLQYQVIMTGNNESPSAELYDLTIGQGGLATITFQVQVDANRNSVISNSGVISASNFSAATSNIVQNVVLPATKKEIGGVDRIETAILLSKEQFPTDQSADCVLLARSDIPIDSLPGAPLASQCNGSILLTPTNSLDSRDITEIKRILDPKETVYLLGREQALGAQVVSTLKANGYSVIKRLGGANRNATSVEIAKELVRLEPSTITKAALANGLTFVDALSVSSPASYKSPTSTRMPILLVTRDQTPSEVKAYIKSNSEILTFYQIGGTKVISQNIDYDLANLGRKISRIRIAGANRFETATKVADYFFPNPAQIFVTSGYGSKTSSYVPVDALLAGSVAGRIKAPLIFTETNSVPKETRSYLNLNEGTIGKVYFIGGIKVISTPVRLEIMNILK